MKKTIKVEFCVSTRYVGSDVEEIIELEIDDTWTQDEINSYIESAFNNWVSNEIETSWEIKE